MSETRRKWLTVTPPQYWRNESSGRLAPVVKKYLEGAQQMTADDIRIMRAYLQQWIESPAWEIADSPTPELAALRRKATEIQSAADIHVWIHQALEIGIDPL